MSNAGDGAVSLSSQPNPVSSDRSSIFHVFREKWIETMFLVGVTGVSVMVGFSRAISNAKKHESEAFDKLPVQQSVHKVHNEATSLAFRALRWGTFYALCGTGLIAFATWKLLGVSNLVEFRYKVGSFLPRLSKSEQEQQGRRDFENLTDLFQYLIDEDEKAKKSKALKGTNKDSSNVK